MSYKSYEEYKDSNIEWIGEIPEHWDVRKMKNLIFFQEGPGLRNWQFTDDGIKVICVTNITEEGIDFSNYKKFISEEEYKQIYQHFTVNKGDLLLSSSGNSWGKVAEYLDDELVILNTSTIRINENKTFGSILNQSFIKYALQSEAIREQLGLMMTGSCQPNFGPTHLAKVLLAYPNSKNTQEQIADYLDKRTSEIDENIAKNKKLILLLDEKKTALINQVVTKGLDPNVPMKDSGIEWIGKIPEHWNSRKINTLSIIGRGASPRPIDDPIYFDINGDYSWVRISDVTSSKKYLLKTEEKLSVLGKSLSVPIEPGNIFISIAATVGKPIISKIKCCIHDGFVYFKNLKINDGYLFYIFEGEECYKGLGKLGTQLNLNRETIGKIHIPIPPKNEQNLIEDYLDKETSKIDKTINKIKENIDLLEEYKTSLIHNVVTGKIDVRGEEI